MNSSTFLILLVVLASPAMSEVIVETFEGFAEDEVLTTQIPGIVSARFETLAAQTTYLIDNLTYEFDGWVEVSISTWSGIKDLYR